MGEIFVWFRDSQDNRQLFVCLFVVVVYFILSSMLYLAFSANLGLLYMPHPGIRPLVLRPFRRTAELAVLVVHLEGRHPVYDRTALYWEGWRGSRSKLHVSFLRNISIRNTRLKLGKN